MLQILVERVQWAAFWGLEVAMLAVVVMRSRSVLPRWYGVLDGRLRDLRARASRRCWACPTRPAFAGPVWLVVTALVLLKSGGRWPDPGSTTGPDPREGGPGLVVCEERVRLEQRAQHVRHDPAVAVVALLARGVDAHQDGERLLLALRRARSARAARGRRRRRPRS